MTSSRPVRTLSGAFLGVLAALALGVTVLGASPVPSMPTASPAAISPGPSMAASSAPSFVPVERLTWQVISTRPHDLEAWTEGLLVDGGGQLYESTGLVGESSVRQVDRVTGAVIRSVETPVELYGEGLAQVADHLIQLTWKDGQALVWDTASLTRVGSFRYTGEGWGLCYDGSRLVMSDGSSTLTFRDPVTFEVMGTLDVSVQGQAVDRLNELECVDGSVWANVWETPWIVRIDATTGAVTGALDTSGIITPDPSVADAGAVLNGIAYDPASDTFLLTGKRWPTTFEVRIGGS